MNYLARFFFSFFFFSKVFHWTKLTSKVLTLTLRFLSIYSKYYGANSFSFEEVSFFALCLMNLPEVWKKKLEVSQRYSFRLFTENMKFMKTSSVWDLHFFFSLKRWFLENPIESAILSYFKVMLNFSLFFAIFFVCRCSQYFCFLFCFVFFTVQILFNVL